jgi:hypothetical protein
MRFRGFVQRGSPSKKDTSLPLQKKVRRELWPVIQEGASPPTFGKNRGNKRLRVFMSTNWFMAAGSRLYRETFPLREH